jgi:hypothetical protein
MVRRAGAAKSVKAHGFRGCHRETFMIRQIGEKWRGFWRMASNVALSMDADPLEDIHRRIRRLEAAVFQSEVGREPVAPSTSANHGALREQTEHSRNT